METRRRVIRILSIVMLAIAAFGASYAIADVVYNHLLPSADDTYDLGSASYQWRNIYLGGAIVTDDVRTAGPLVNVKHSDYGAIGDGVNDDTAELQAAIDYAEASGGEVYLPVGKYYITSTLTIDNSITFRGAGATFDQTAPDSLHESIIYGPGVNCLDIQCDGARIYDLTIMGDKSGGWGIRCGSATQSFFGTKIMQVRVYQKNVGLLINGTSAYSQFAMQIYDCASYGLHVNLLASSFFNGNTFHYLNTHFNDDDGARFESAGGSFAHNIFDGFSSENNGGYGLNFTDSIDTATFRGNIFRGFGCENNSSGNINMPSTTGEGTNTFIFDPQAERCAWTIDAGVGCGYGGLQIVSGLERYTFNALDGMVQFKMHSNGTPALYAENSAAGNSAYFVGPIGIDVKESNASIDVGGGTRNYVDGVDDILVKDDVEIDGSLYVATMTFTNAISASGRVDFATTTVDVPGPTDNLDVSGVNVVKIDTRSNSVTIGGFTGGVDGQVLYVVVVDATNWATLEYNETGNTQKIFLSSGGDESRASAYGGWTLVFDSGNGHWYEVDN